MTEPMTFLDTGASTDAKHTSYEEVSVKENTSAVFSHKFTPATSETFEDSSFNVEIKLCEKETYHIVCWCRWMSDSNGVCKNQTISSVCEADKSEMRFTLFVKRTYRDIMWELFRQNSTPLVLKYSKLQVTYPATITALRLNGRDVNGTEYVAENQESSISCSFINGNPAVSIRLVDGKGSTLSSTRQKEGPLVLSRDFNCNDVRLTIGCEAPGSELNRYVTILVKCLPELSPISKQVLDLARIVGEKITFRMKSYTSNIRKCRMTKMPPQPITKEVACSLSGSVPEFNLTLNLSTESWIGQGIWMLHVITEIGNSNISFGLIDSSAF
ncbi:uncharacterized protein LOC112567452 [Pomacea canaliculata]|uniref:uncharacterized protein LOC112567452 n=1 Tax=Pomacea canaliculata TaxID=400727 RepID=UPI000D72C0FD|nr:uncharacterized protein LOC112567452 [Pomacea canaliculata]